MGGGATNGAPTSAPCVASSKAALSRTERVSACTHSKPAHPIPCAGPAGVRARVGLSPKRPHHAAGIRVEPPPSLALAAGTYPAATATADPPEEPPGEHPTSHGLRVAP